MAEDARPSPRKRREAVADRLHSLAIHLLRRLRREDEATGLTPARLSALSVVVFAGPLRMGELAAAEGVQPPTMTRLAQSLERDGYLLREPDPKDGRSVTLRATKRGEELLHQGRRRRIEALLEALGTLDEGELRTLEEAVRVLERRLGTSTTRQR